SAESEEGRPLIKEIAHQSGTHPTQSGARVSQQVSLPRPANPPKLTSRHINNLRVVTTRFELLTLLPSNGIVAEVGVDEGHYSENILRLSNPKRLHLIDVWSSERFGEDKLNKVQVASARKLNAVRWS